MTVPELQDYIMHLAKLQAAGQPYTVDMKNGTVSTPYANYEIIIPDEIASDIRLEEA